MTDPSGRRTGFDPDTKKDLNEIPTSRYDVQSIGPWDGDKPEISSREFSTALGSADTLVDGDYTIRVIGETGGPFSLDIDVQRDSKSDSFTINGSIERGQSKLYSLHYTADSSRAILIDTLATR